MLLAVPLIGCGAGPSGSAGSAGPAGAEAEFRCSAAVVAGGGRAEASAISCRRVAP